VQFGLIDLDQENERLIRGPKAALISGSFSSASELNHYENRRLPTERLVRSNQRRFQIAIGFEFRETKERLSLYCGISL
jgi:hypothetical protein